MRFFATLCALLFAMAGPAASWPLVSAEEDQRDRDAPHVEDPEGTATKAPPTITLKRPDAVGPIRNPVSIELRFEPGPGSSIDIGSVRATYGWLGLDITRRLLAHAVLTPDGLSADDVEIPLGNHNVTISVADTAGRVGTRTFQFSIVR